MPNSSRHCGIARPTLRVVEQEGGCDEGCLRVPQGHCTLRLQRPQRQHGPVAGGARGVLKVAHFSQLWHYHHVAGRGALRFLRADVCYLTGTHPPRQRSWESRPHRRWRAPRRQLAHTHHSASLLSAKRVGRAYQPQASPSKSQSWGYHLKAPHRRADENSLGNVPPHPARANGAATPLSAASTPALCHLPAEHRRRSAAVSALRVGRASNVRDFQV